jgi:hypothetical protein
MGEGRALLVRILDNFVNKFSSLKKQIPKIVSQPLEDDDAKPGTLQSQKRKRSQARTLASIKGTCPSPPVPPSVDRATPVVALLLGLALALAPFVRACVQGTWVLIFVGASRRGRLPGADEEPGDGAQEHRVGHHLVHPNLAHPPRGHCGSRW